MLMTLELPETSVPAARRPVLQSRRDLTNPPEHRSHRAHDRPSFGIETGRISKLQFQAGPPPGQ